MNELVPPDSEQKRSNCVQIVKTNGPCGRICGQFLMGFIGKPAAVPSKVLLKNKFDHVPSFNGVDCYGNQEWMVKHYICTGTVQKCTRKCAARAVLLFCLLNKPNAFRTFSLPSPLWHLSFARKAL